MTSHFRQLIDALPQAVLVHRNGRPLFANAKFSGLTGDAPGWKRLEDFLNIRLERMEKILAGREWLAGSFSVADILMSDVLRLVDRFDGLAMHPACHDYVARATARPAFVKALRDQLTHFAAAD